MLEARTRSALDNQLFQPALEEHLGGVVDGTRNASSYVKRRCNRNESVPCVVVEEFGLEIVDEMDGEPACVAADDECGDHVTRLLEGGRDTG